MILSQLNHAAFIIPLSRPSLHTAIQAFFPSRPDESVGSWDQGPKTTYLTRQRSKGLVQNLDRIPEESSRRDLPQPHDIKEALAASKQSQTLASVAWEDSHGVGGHGDSVGSLKHRQCIGVVGHGCDDQIVAD
jgi:hypothetical protein